MTDLEADPPRRIALPSPVCERAHIHGVAVLEMSPMMSDRLVEVESGPSVARTPMAGEMDKFRL